MKPTRLPHVALFAFILPVLPLMHASVSAAEKKGSGKAAAAATPTPAKPAATPVATPPPAAPMAAPAAESGPSLSPEDLEALRAKLGQVVTIEGIAVRAAESKSKTVRFLDFANGAGRAITVVFVAGKGEPVQMEEVQAWVGKNLRVTGTVSEFNGKLQLPIEKKSQIVEVMP
jgi:hypothetical protein